MIYLNSSKETICFVKKWFVSHWINQDLDSSFKVPLKNTWDIHNFTSQYQDLNFLIIAESDRGP